MDFSSRAQAVALRSYHRPKKENTPLLETWEEVTSRVIRHQKWLWERALKRSLNNIEEAELAELKTLILERKILPAGRTLWLGGTPISQKRESSMFNCAFTHVETVYDLVDAFWLLLQGCGVGFRPVPGTLNGFRIPLQNVKIIPSTRKDTLGNEKNEESFDPDQGVWMIKVGDSAEAWAKVIGKLVAGKYDAKQLVLDFSEIRPEGSRLKEYGWISGGYRPFAMALQNIAKILSLRADQLLTRMDILDIVNFLGTVLVSRRSAQMAIFEYGQPEWEEFAQAKKKSWQREMAHRQQSNNSLLFYAKPSKKELEYLFNLMLDSGGSEPGLINGVEATRRAPWFKGCNPCGEILLGNKCFCNLSEVNLLAFLGDQVGLEHALKLTARMNYRQTMVNLRDEILQEAWHLNNQFLHLCGVSLTGIRARTDLTDYDYKKLRNIAVSSAYSMAHELNSPLPKNVTCVKPSGTLSKIMGSEALGEIPEGIHLPLGKYIFNWITFSIHDPLVERFKKAHYEIKEKPFDTTSVLIKFPVHYEHIPFPKKEGVELNNESAVDQLNWYMHLQNTWCEQNVSNTIYYDPSEIPSIIDWLYKNWDRYVGVSFLLRHDPTKTPEDLGFVYLPQAVVTKEEYEKYIRTLKPVDFEGIEYIPTKPIAGCETDICETI